MIIRLLAVAALLTSAGASIAIAQEGHTAQQCNCPKCQAARKAHEEAVATYSAMPAGLFAEPQAPDTTVQPQPAVQAQPAVQPAGFHHHHNAAAMPYMNQCPPSWAAGGGYQGGGMSGYGYHHPGYIHTGGGYGPYGGAHGTPGYPRHLHM